MKIKNRKKSLFFTMFSVVAVAGTAVSLALTLTSCNSDQTSEKLIVPTANHSEFTNLNSQGGLTSILASVLSTKEGRQSVATTASNKILSSWFENINNPTLQADYQEWQENAEKSYQNKYDDYKKNKGSNWKQLFQIEVLDPVGGTKEAYIQDQINQNLQTTFINNLFAKNYEGVAIKKTESVAKNEVDSMDSREVQAINSGSAGVVNNEENINGIGGAGNKNAFVFSAETVSPSNRQSVDYGYADFMEFLMDEWVYNELPIPVVMSLWKNAEKPVESGLFDIDYFGKDTIGESGSYNFQYFTPASANAQEMTTTTKYQLLVQNLDNYVNQKTGAIDLPTIFTEDSSTKMTIKADNLFDGSIATPFSAATWYKLTTSVFQNTDTNMPTASSLDEKSIMKNFIAQAQTANTNEVSRNSKQTNNNQTGVFHIPYLDTSSNGTKQKEVTNPFKGEYENMINGIKDTVNLVKSSSSTSAGTANSIALAKEEEKKPSEETLSNFIITRDSFGVHLIGIDRLSQIIKAVGSETQVNGKKAQTQTTSALDKYKKMVTEIRNTFMYRAAQDIVNNESNYKLQDSLKTYLQNNFSNLIIKYALRIANNSQKNNDANKYNLFGSLVMDNKAWNPSTNKEGEQENTSSENYNKFKSVLDILKSSNKLAQFITDSANLDAAEKTLKFTNNIKQQMYAAQSSYNDTTSVSLTDHKGWRKYGIAGVMPYTRDSENGNFTNLVKPVNELLKEIKSNTQSTLSKPTRNDINNSSLTIAVDETALGQKSTDLTTIDNSYKYVLKEKLDLMNQITGLLNSGSTSNGQVKAIGQNLDGQVAPTSYIFTTDDFVNGAIEAVSKNSHLSTIIQNLYTQNYLTFQNKISDDTTTKSRVAKLNDNQTTTSKTAFYDFANNKINTNNDTKEFRSTSEGDVKDVKESIQKAIDSNYLINNFKNLPNLYYDGNWDSLEKQKTKDEPQTDSIYQIAKEAWTKSWITSQYTFKIGNDLVVGYEDPTSASSYQKFLITLEYLFTYNADGSGSFSFKNLQDFLLEMTEDNNRAMVAWVSNSSFVGNPSFGIQGNQNGNSELTNAEAIRTKIQDNYKFSGNPIYLDKLTPYAYFGAPNAFKQQEEQSIAASSETTTSSNLTEYNYTTSSNYWNTATMMNSTSGVGKNGSGSTNTPATGFLGFQVNNGSDFGVSNSITSEAFNNSTYSISASLGQANADYNYQGVLYQYGTGKDGRDNLIKAVNGMSTINQLVDFYNNVLISSNLPITQDSKDTVQGIIDKPNPNQTDKISQLSSEIVKIIQDKKQVPIQAFQRLEALPLWNKQALGVTSTLFADGSSQSMYNEYVVTLFNEQDVKNLVNEDGKLNTKTSATANSKKDGENDSEDQKLGYLGLTKDAFYSAVIMLASNNTELQDKAMKAMLKDIGKVKVYDMRLATSLDSAWISNYSAWEKVINATNSSSDSSN